MDYMKVSEAAEKWELSARRVRILCQENRIEGVIRKGNLYMIPTDAKKPEDARSKGRSRTALKKLLKNIDENLEKLSSMRPLTKGEVERLRHEFLIEFTYNSNAIEGNTLTLQETAMVLEGVTIDQKPLKEHLEIIGHRDAFQYVESLVSDKVEFSEYVIKNIHSLVLIDRPEDRGTYRRIPVRIMGAFHEPPQPYMVEPMMNDLIVNHSQRKEKMHLVEAVALFHLDFEGIHPFIDGNGRTGRLLINFELMQHGYPAIDVKFSDRRKYYQAFDDYYRNQNEIPMVEMVAGYVNERLQKYLKLLN
ncbi:Fic family protein [Anaerotignum propionicum]|uniref:Fic/DOC family protein n=1 Tax=Anaerotignum propionicum DSM 1682 TaxID=991789 RepID=A0A0X1U7L2_ANAPI|nr:Fic family protein [Anaerotignum propionicum]AMJ40929.1 Fic/DOC family protein [Anaerotignum propionicum DSM 1682]SHE59076.1 Fic/DOC family protein [[Clostridium] propionicum DSM 1682] [Anaerotignum propionicum DSM 1682]